MKEKIQTSRYLKKIFETPSNEFSEWFGYYNYDSLNFDQTKMLCNRSKVDGVPPEKGMTIELGYYDIPGGVWHHIGESDSWNWQQGAMLQWLPGAMNRSKVIYNTSKEGHLISVIHDIDTKEEKQINWAIYGITPDGTKSISLEFERSFWCRAYHYQSIANPYQEGRIIESDGIFEIDLITNTRKRIITIRDIINCGYKPEFASVKHWVEHIMISPNGTRFCFLHRFSPMDNVLKYETRLFIADINGANLQLINNWEKFDWSHFGWKNENEFAIYTQTPYRYANHGGVLNILKTCPFNIPAFFQSVYYSLTSRLPFVLSSLLGGKYRCYQLYKTNSLGEFKLIKKLGSNLLDIDGHPSFAFDNYLITDSYPDKHGYQRLMVVDSANNKGLLLARLFASYNGNPASCDLHPKLCCNNEYVVVDTAFDKKHHMIIFRLDWNQIRRDIA